MSTSVIPSTFLLTLLLSVGLLFFIRASVKDRTTELRLACAQSEENLLGQLRQYFADRAYRVISIDAQANQVLLEGNVQPSLFLAVFLSFLAAVGALCLVLILSVSVPQASILWFGILALSPLTGWFYWRKAGRLEQVTFRLEPATAGKSLVVVKGHRDEITVLRESLNLEIVERL